MNHLFRYIKGHIMLIHNQGLGSEPMIDYNNNQFYYLFNIQTLSNLGFLDYALYLEYLSRVFMEMSS